MDAVLILFGDHMSPVKPDPATKFLTPSWSDSMKTMSDTSFLTHIIKYPTDQMTDEMMDLLVPYFRNSLYTFEAAQVACGNVAGLLKWTIAMTKYFTVNKDIIPVKYKMAVSQYKLKCAENEEAKAQALLAEKEKEVAEEEKKMKVETDKKDAVFAKAKKTQDKMTSATDLIDGLSGEKTRWIDQIAQNKTTVTCLVGDVLYLTAFLSYVGPFNQDYRKRLQETWRDYMYGKRIPISAKINVIDSLSDMATVGEWNIQGLPKDELSAQNGVIVTKASRYPLIIDPQSQGKVWITNMEKDAGLIITTLSNRFFRNHIEDCISSGKSILIEDVGEELDSALDNILEKNIIKQGKSLKVKVSDKEVDYHPDFRLYITTKLANPVYSPEICAVCIYLFLLLPLSKCDVILDGKDMHTLPCNVTPDMVVISLPIISQPLGPSIKYVRQDGEGLFIKIIVIICSPSLSRGSNFSSSLSEFLRIEISSAKTM